MSRKPRRSIFRVPRTLEQIERAARELRQKLGIDERLSPNLLEVLHNLTSCTGWKVKFVDSHPHSKDVRAWTNGKKKILHILNRIKKDLEYGDERAREIIAQEFGHLALDHEGLRYDKANRSLIVHAVDESEAKDFMRCFLVPWHLAEKYETADQLKQIFRVTPDTSRIRQDEIREERRRREIREAQPQPVSDVTKLDRPYDFTKYPPQRPPSDSDKKKLLSEFELFRGNGGGIENWFSNDIPQRVVEALLRCEHHPLSHEELNQLLILSHEAGMSNGFFKFYFLTNSHPKYSWYDPKKLPDFDPRYLKSQQIMSLKHLKWGLYRLYVDALLYFGNIRQAYRSLRSKSEKEIQEFFSQMLFNSQAMIARGKSLPIETVAHEDRYLIAEKACKTYQPSDPSAPALIDYLKAKYREKSTEGRDHLTIKELVSSVPAHDKYTSDLLLFSLNEVLDITIDNEIALDSRIRPLLERFQSVRARALANTDLYISMCQDLDVYVATSMRDPTHFRAMAKFCDEVFQNRKLMDLKLRYFDPTLSAAESHEDKGLIECLMVDRTKMLIYIAGETDSFGKAVEAAMALNRGKPVIFYCDVERMRAIYRDIHPLSRLVNFENGVAVGGIVTNNTETVVELISRIFRNDMEFELKKKNENYFLLSEKLTGSTIRIQTDDRLLRETFWNYYHTRR